MNVVLVGYRGTGKSAIAGRVAQELGLRVVSLDAELVRAAGQSIPEIVEARGWAGFRDLEEEIVRTFAARDGQVIDCGGGVVERENNFQVLRASGTVFWLTATVPTIVERIQGDTERPSLTGTKSFTEEVAEVLARRRPLYQRIAHHEIATDDRQLDAIATEIIDLVRATASR